MYCKFYSFTNRLGQGFSSILFSILNLECYKNNLFFYQFGFKVKSKNVANVLYIFSKALAQVRKHFCEYIVKDWKKVVKAVDAVDLCLCAFTNIISLKTKY